MTHSVFVLFELIWIDQTSLAVAKADNLIFLHQLQTNLILNGKWWINRKHMIHISSLTTWNTVKTVSCFPPWAEYYALVEPKLHTQMTTRRHDIGMIHTPLGAAVMVHYTRGWRCWWRWRLAGLVLGGPSGSSVLLTLVGEWGLHIDPRCVWVADCKCHMFG